MIFLVEYDRQKGKLVSLQTFSAADRLFAQSQRLKRELYLNECGVSREVLLLEAENQKALGAHINVILSPLKNLPNAM